MNRIQVFLLLENNRRMGRRGHWTVTSEEVALLWSPALVLTAIQLVALGRQHLTLPVMEAVFPTTLLSAGECSGMRCIRLFLRYNLRIH